MSETTVSMMQTRRDPALKAIVQKRVPLFYSQGADPAIDRPAHVRAGSSLTWLGDKLALVQDDANFLVFIDPESLTVEAITLVAGMGNNLTWLDMGDYPEGGTASHRPLIPHCYPCRIFERRLGQSLNKKINVPLQGSVFNHSKRCF